MSFDLLFPDLIFLQLLLFPDGEYYWIPTPVDPISSLILFLIQFYDLIRCYRVGTPFSSNKSYDSCCWLLWFSGILFIYRVELREDSRMLVNLIADN